MPGAVGKVTGLLNMSNKTLASFLCYCQKFKSERSYTNNIQILRRLQKKKNLGTVYKIFDLYFPNVIEELK